MRKILILVLAMLSLVGCVSNNERNRTETQSVKREEVNIEEKIEEQPIEIETSENEEETKELLVELEKLPYTIEIKEPDSVGIIYGTATFTNNSEYPIINYSLTFLLPSSNERTYYSIYDTVMPGEISPNFTAFGEENMQLLKYEYTYRDKNNEDVHVKYDIKLEEYSIW